MKSVLVSPYTWLILFALAASLLVSVGVSFEFGLGYGLVSGGLFSLLYSAVIFKGLNNG